MTDSFRWMNELDVVSRALQPLRDMQRVADPFSDIRRAIEVESTILASLRREEAWRKPFSDMGHLSALTQLNEQLDRQCKLFEGPVEQAWRVGALAPGVYEAVRGGLTAAQFHQIAHMAAFRLPQVNEIETLARRAAEAADLTRRTFATTALEAEMARMHQPWLRVGAEAASARGFAEIQAIGHGIAERSPFGGGFAKALRGPLGDWRDPIPPASNRWLDPDVRTAFYLDRGFDVELTDFTPPAFDASLRIAGLRSDETDDADGDQDVDRAGEAFATLRSFEAEVRLFLDRVMREAFGDAWMRHRLPPTMLEQWIAKRDKAKAGGQTEALLIHYADFADYKMIIERSDNWKAVFKGIFRRQEDMGESFQRLYPIRIATMHARTVTQEDELLLVVETRRILQAIGTAS
jgi:hypothetical protein